MKEISISELGKLCENEIPCELGRVLVDRFYHGPTPLVITGKEEEAWYKAKIKAHLQGFFIIKSVQEGRIITNSELIRAFAEIEARLNSDGQSLE